MSNTEPTTDHTWTVTDEEGGHRLERVLARRLPELSRSQLRGLFAAGRVRLAGKVAAKGALVAPGQVFALAATAEELQPCARPDPTVPVVLLLETPVLLVVDKPAGLPCAPLRPGETGTLASGLLARYPELAGIGWSPREPGLVNRLDTDTSGLLLVARTPAAFTQLRGLLQEGGLRKDYLLLCDSVDLPDSGLIDVPLAPHPKDRRKVVACPLSRDRDRYGARPALTRYRVLRRSGELALVEAEASAATRHQVRAHFAFLGHPLAGDPLYGGPALPGLTRQALHASRLAWGGGEGLPAFDVTSTLPEELARFVGPAV